MLEQTHLYREIHQQPQVLRELLEGEKDAVRELVSAFRGRQITHLVIAARGTSDNAARYAKYLLGSVNGLPVGLATPSLFTIYRQPPRLAEALVLGISQSGKSPDIVAVLAEARRQGALTAAISNFPDSDLAREADHVIHLRAGEERSIAATKTYTCELAAIALLSASLADDAQMLAALERVPEAVAAALSLNDGAAQIAERYRYMRRCIVIGRGYNYATAFELALKLKELTYTIAEPYSSADFLHGPLALIEPGFPVIVVTPSGAMLSEMLDFVQTLKDHGAEVLVISDSPEALASARTPLALPGEVPEWLSPITAIVPGQLFAMHLAHARDYDPDRPRSLRKVTETR
jgi:glucosamine--fructose-6-phosphate aminotransferase (isomerizing)